jgi:thiol-disulfide isomerase/thioredoxin
MMTLTRRSLALAAAGTVAAGVPLRKLRAEALQGMDALHLQDPPKPVDVHFTDADGTARTLADYAGKGIVLNMWATWCVPCVAEMPALAAFASVVAKDGIVVLPLSSDRAGAAIVTKFYKDLGVGNLPVLLDPMSAAAHALGIRGIPTTLVIDRKGREVAWLEGSFDWASDPAVAEIRKLVG